MTVHVILPWPPAATSANASGQGKWRRKSDAARDYKSDCAILCKAARVPFLDAPAADVTVIFCPPRNGRFDLDNMVGRAKQGLDAVAEAVGIDDGKWSSMMLERGEKTPGGAVHVYVTPSRWKSIGSLAGTLINETSRKRRQPSAALTKTPAHSKG